MGVVLATNDDGIQAPGLRSLVEALQAQGHKVYVVAPLRHMSGSGKSFGVPARLGETSFPGAARAWWVDSTPATAVYLALHGLLEEEPDIVVSGVNRGPNMGLEDVLTSGTVGAAIEAALHGVPGVAVSYSVEGAYDGSYSLPARVGAETAGIVLEHGDRRPMVVNVNVPRNPRGVAPTVLAWNNYRLSFRIDDGVARPVGNTIENRYWDRRPGTDVWAVMNGLVSVTLLDIAGLPCKCSRLEEARRVAARLAERLGLPLEQARDIGPLEGVEEA